MIAVAGGVDPLGTLGAKSRTTSWEEIEGASPDIVVAMPCGWDARRALQEADEHRDRIAALGAERVWAVDAAASFSRPGPRLIEGTELLAHLLHPDRIGAPEGVAFIEVEASAPARS
jgi:iron complex transport system substrate-binding protein